MRYIFSDIFCGLIFFFFFYHCGCTHLNCLIDHVALETFYLNPPILFPYFFFQFFICGCHGSHHFHFRTPILIRALYEEIKENPMQCISSRNSPPAKNIWLGGVGFETFGSSEPPVTLTMLSDFFFLLLLQIVRVDSFTLCPSSL